jgi:hypothetical protein
MRLSRSVGAKAALACGVLLTTLALAAPTFAAEATNYMPVSRDLTLYHRPADPRPTAPAPGTIGPFWPDFFGPYVSAPRKSDTDGLSRNPEDCNSGCIDNGRG